MLKARMKAVVGKSLPVDFLEKITEYAIAEQADAVSLAGVETIATDATGWDHVERGREILWERLLGLTGRPAVLLLEFGVHQGASMRYLAGLNRDPESRFLGFDSFEGLPEVWRGTSTGYFDVGGQIPQIDDARVSFVKGWFRDTVPGRLDELAALSESRSPVVIFDADLYSSTLYLLFTLGQRFRRYHFVFDEFSGHETRALFNYCQATGATARFFHRVDWQGCPQVVSGELSHPS